MRAGVAHSEEPHSFVSGRKIARSAMSRGGVSRADLVFAFFSGQRGGEAFFEGLRSVVGPHTPIIGGSAIGIITNDFLSYEGFTAAAAVIQMEGLHCRVASADNLNEDERKAGRNLALGLTDDRSGRLLLLFYDSVRVSPSETTPPIMNASPPLIEGIEEALARPVPIIGAGLVGDYNFGPTMQFCGTRVGRQSATGALLSGDFHFDWRIMHGCVPKDGVYHTITKMGGPVIYEIDGRPVVEMLDEMYGSRDWRHQVPVKRLTIGVHYGERYGEQVEGEFVNRLIAGVLPESDGIVLFEPDLKEGTEVLFMLRDSKMMLESARQNAKELLNKIASEGKTPIFGLYIDCAGRAASYSDTLTEEAAEVQAALNQWGVPLLGFYSGVEVAPLLGRTRGLDWTGVLLVLAAEGEKRG
jgi:hypothetical protein